MLGHHRQESKITIVPTNGGWCHEVPYYVTCAYYQDGKDLSALRDEMERLKSQGHTRFKAKIGGLSLESDIERLETIRDVIGFDTDLMVDVNRAWDLKTAIRATELLAPLKPRWLEEPLHWTDDRYETTLLLRRRIFQSLVGRARLRLRAAGRF